MYEFRIISCENGSEIIDRSLKTPYSALTPTRMTESACYFRSYEKKSTERRRKKKKARKKSIIQIGLSLWDFLKMNSWI